MSATSDFITTDFGATLFPLKTNILMVTQHENEINEYIYQKILDEKNKSDNFLSQQRVYATKPHGHLRRTSKLDPVAEAQYRFLIDRPGNTHTWSKVVLHRRRCEELLAGQHNVVEVWI